MTSDQTMTDIDNLLSDFTETIDKWQQANDARYEQMKAQHNALAEAHNALAEAHNAHIVKHAKDAEQLGHVTHVVNENAEGQRQQHWLIVGAIALAAFALGRGA